MERLPFLVEHGDTVWRAIAVLGAVLAIAIVRVIQVGWERRSSARVLGACAARTTGPVEGVATIRGTLRGGRARSVSLLHLRGRAPYYDERAPGLWLDCGGERVALHGPIRVLHGTRVVSTRDRHSAVPDGEAAVRSSPILHRLAARTVSVGDGDPVYVTARLAPRPGDAEHGYRDAITAWTATAPGRSVDACAAVPPTRATRPRIDPPATAPRRRVRPASRELRAEIEIVAASPVVRAVPLDAARTVATGLAGAALVIAALWGAGRIALGWSRPAEPSRDQAVRALLDERDPLVLAAATPGNRGEALALLETRLARDGARDPETFARWRRMARLRGGCGGEIEAQLAQGTLEGLAELARDCSDDRAAADAYQYLGRFLPAALRDLERPAGERHIGSLIATGAWLRAAWWMAVHRAGAEAAGDRARAARLGCAEQWFRRMAGEVGATAARRAEPPRDPVCVVIDALGAPEPRRAAALTAAAELPHAPPLAAALARGLATPAELVASAPIARTADRPAIDPADPIAAIAGATMRRDAARRARDFVRAADWQEILDRHVKAFSSYATLTGLIVRELVRPAAP